MVGSLQLVVQICDILAKLDVRYDLLVLSMSPKIIIQDQGFLPKI